MCLELTSANHIGSISTRLQHLPLVKSRATDPPAGYPRILTADTRANLIPERPGACDGDYLSPSLQQPRRPLYSHSLVCRNKSVSVHLVLFCLSSPPLLRADLPSEPVILKQDPTRRSQAPVVIRPFRLAQISASPVTSSIAFLEIFSKACRSCFRAHHPPSSCT